MTEQIVRPVVFDIQGRLEKSFKVVEEMLEELKQHEDPRIRLAAAAEMRHHSGLAAQTLKLALDADAEREFEAGVLDALAEAGVKVRRTIMGLFEVRAAEGMMDEG